MERLTKWEDDSITYNEKRKFECGEYCDSCSQGAGNCETIKNMIKKLADYEDLEEQGLLVRLPCKPGDTMFDIVGKPPKIIEHQASSFYIDENGIHLRILGGALEKKQGAKVYFSREEAEKKLEEMKNDKA